MGNNCQTTTIFCNDCQDLEYHTYTRVKSPVCALFNVNLKDYKTYENGKDRLLPVKCPICIETGCKQY